MPALRAGNCDVLGGSQQPDPSCFSRYSFQRGVSVDKLVSSSKEAVFISLIAMTDFPMVPANVTAAFGIKCCNR